MRVLRTILLLAVLAAIGAVTLWEAEERLSPGPLHPAHQRVPTLVDSEGCALCHGQGTEQDAMAKACGACHEEVFAQLGTTDGLHGSLPAATATTCGVCHREHHGDALAPIEPMSWQRAGVEDPAAYAHEHVAEFPLHGRHGELDCSACHEHAASDLPPPGNLRFLGTETSCGSCHRDVHEGAFGNDCARCHGQERPFAEAPGFTHDAFPLEGAHRSVSCENCHDDLSGTSITSHREQARGCADCHQDPHDGSGTALRIVADSTDCARCHDTAAFAGTTFGVAAHADHGVELRGAHTSTACAGCHGPEKVAARLAARVAADAAMSRCADCHVHPHREPLLAGLDAATCGDCHLDLDRDFSRGRLLPEQHDVAATGFPLVSPHADLACADCHGEDLAPATDYAARHPDRSADDCRACHGDPHEGRFDQGPLARLLNDRARAAAGATASTDCLRCHDRDAYLPHRFGIDLHGAVTTFALEGAHRAVDCSGCHGAPTGDGPRDFHGAPGTCADCHEDPHRGRFDRAGPPAAIDGRTGCARCHDVTSFRSVPAPTHGQDTFDHALWTGHSLEGRHAAASCADCHGRDERGSLGTAPQRCADCHADVHAGQFATWVGDRRTAPADCRRCHAPRADDFHIERFDHARLTRFALDDNHRDVACDKCHLPVATRDGGEVVRYRPLPTDCRACHLPGGRR